MQHSVWSFLAVVNLWLLAATLAAATRPRYGGALRVELRAAVLSLDPSEWPAEPAQAGAKERLAALVFEQLVRIDESGRPQPALALSWRSDSTRRRWQFQLRPGVKFHDGAPLTPAVVVAALGASQGAWQASAAGGAVVIRSAAPVPGLFEELASARRAVFLKSPDGAWLGTGPFRVASWEPGRRATFTANEEYWNGRPFVDAIGVAMGQPPRESLLNLELGRADLVELEPGEIRRASREETRIWSSAPVELVALVFDPGRPAAEDPRVREALALSIDRGAIHTVLLQKQGEPTGALLPQWVSGYAFLFPADRDLARARSIAAALPASSKSLSLGVDGADGLARTVAERIAVNAREAGINLRLSTPADLRVVRVRIVSSQPERVFENLAGVPLPGAGPLEALYEKERALLEERRIIPLFHLPGLFGVGARVKTWNTPGLARDGRLHLEDVWLETSTP